MTSELTDFKSHHIEGYAIAAMEKGQDGHFECPLISHITGNLWMGGCIGGVKLADDFDYVVSLYPWEKYSIGPTTNRFEYKLLDSDQMIDAYLLDEIVNLAHLRVSDGKTLIHCQAGLNRSGLISALVLMRDGYTGQEAIDLLRNRRDPYVLCNETFEQYILGL